MTASRQSPKNTQSPFSTTITASEKPPASGGLPVVGNTIEFLTGGLDALERFKEYGNIVRYRAVGNEFVVIFDPTLVSAVLLEQNDLFEKGPFETEFLELLGPTNVVAASGTEWKQLREAMGPAFRPEQLENHRKTIRDTTRTALNRWISADVVDCYTAATELTLTILCNTLFSINQSDERHTVIRSVANAIHKRSNLGALGNLLPDWMPATPTERRYRQTMAVFDDLVAEILEERRNATDPPEDVLSALLAEPNIDDSTIRDQLTALLFAGHETTAITLGYALWLIAGTQSVATEIRSAVPETTAPIENAITETLRLYPPIHSLYRTPCQPVQCNGYRLPADTTIQLPVYSLHRDNRWWTKPDAFMPNRWTDRSPQECSAYLPFGRGPRHCLGMRFATTELTEILRVCLAEATFERRTVDPKTEAKAFLTPDRLDCVVTPVGTD
ncbi:cytochrome P450 [Halocatena halophila]|uniref:cytochrome P450 n=1 Tax=Halocatena halophila TaxID=2814576 RepID=UPI002ED3C8F0